jgi:glycosyltransferase involved in cell wall biosynthesis
MVKLLEVILIRSRAIDPSINKVAKTLSKNGYDVKLLVWDRMGNTQTEKVDGYRVYRFGLKAPHDKTSVLFYLPIWWLYEFFFLLKHRSTIVHVCDLDTLIPAIFAKLIKKTKLCYTIYDFYADNLPNKFPSIFRKLIAFTERFGIRFTNALFLVDKCRYEQVKESKINRIEYIYNSPQDRFIPVQENHSNAEEGLKIFYAGVIHKSRGLEYLIKAIEHITDVKLTIAGTGPDKDFLENISSDTKAYIRYIGPIPYEEVIERTIESDLLFAFYDPSIPNNKYASPNKLFEAMMCGKPIIMNSGIAASEIILEEECGLIVPYGDINAIREAITKIKNYPELRVKLGENGRKAYEEKYNWKIMEKRLLNTYSLLSIHSQIQVI